MILSSKKIEYEEMDIASSEDTKEKMREIAGNPKQLPPVICNDDTFCGVNITLRSYFKPLLTYTNT